MFIKKIKILKMYEDVTLPFYSRSQDACMDICSYEDTEIGAGEAKAVRTGLKLEIPKNYEINIRARSGLALKSLISVLNAPGTIDENYRGELMIILFNNGKENFKISKNSRIAQMSLQKVRRFRLVPVKEIKSSERGDKGFGSSG
jgi:dUTP pyrophosphatase